MSNDDITRYLPVLSSISESLKRATAATLAAALITATRRPLSIADALALEQDIFGQSILSQS
jgi:hypothetical protein